MYMYIHQCMCVPACVHVARYEVWAALMMVSRTKYEQVPDRLHILAYDPGAAD